MKFDFSISEKVKLEVKATVKNIRTHHFRHEQLMTEVYDIFVCHICCVMTMRDFHCLNYSCLVKNHGERFKKIAAY